MTNHCKVYFKHFDIGEQDTWFCEACMREFPINNGLTIHHINGRGPGKDVIENLMSLCLREKGCHNKAHSSKSYISKGEFQLIHNYFLQGTRKVFVK